VHTGQVAVPGGRPWTQGTYATQKAGCFDVVVRGKPCAAPCLSVSAHMRLLGQAVVQHARKPPKQRICQRGKEIMRVKQRRPCGAAHLKSHPFERM
jgi:hypothetical protein